MPKQTTLSNAKIVWYGEELQNSAKELLADYLTAAAEYVKTQVQRNISISTRSNGPSKPGEYPHADTGRLRNSIFVSVDRKGLFAIVGTNLKYGLYLEYGTSGGVKILPKNAKVLSWVDHNGIRRFAKYVIQGKIEGRSYLRRTLFESKNKLQKIFDIGMTKLKAG